jgi:flagellar motility protein MotE (MotC chaperone)
MTKLIKPLLITVFGLVLGTGTTFFVLWRASGKQIHSIAVAKSALLDAKIPDKPWDFWTIELENMANDLKDERVKVRQRLEQLDQREARLNIDQQELEKTRKQIEALRASIDQRLVEVGEGEAANLKKLSQTYSLLTPKAAVILFKEMDESTMVKLLAIMKPEVVGAIFEEMSRQAASDSAVAKRAAQASEKLRLLKSTARQSP